MPLGKLRAFLHTLFLENEEQTSQKKYRVMCFCSTENDMQNFRHFCKKQKNTSDRHLAWFCTQPFNYGTMLFMSNQVSLPKISLILQKMKVGQNSIYALFARRPSIIYTKMFVWFFNGCSHTWITPRASKSAREQTNYSASIFLGLGTEHILKPINLTTYYHKIIRFIRSFVQSVAPRIRTEII